VGACAKPTEAIAISKNVSIAFFIVLKFRRVKICSVFSMLDLFGFLFVWLWL